MLMIFVYKIFFWKEQLKLKPLLQMVRCEWDSTPSEDTKKMDKHVPMHLRRKLRQNKRKPRVFEVLPPTGSLMPGQRVNVQVKFMPTEEVSCSWL